MSSRSVSALLLSGALLLSPAQQAAADGAEAFVGGLLGGALGTAISNSVQQRRQPVVVEKRYVTRRAPAPAVNSYQRQQNMQVQNALNYFGFPAGTVDGVMGANSRAAIGQYQATLGYPATGVLSEYERAFLTTSYDRAMVGGPQAAQIMASGQGTRGLLLAYRQEQAGVPLAPMPQPASPPVIAAPPAAAPVVEAAVAPEPAAPTPPPAPVEAAAVAAGLPSFLPGAAAVSMDSYCNRVSLATGSNGGFVTAAAMTDPAQALGEQFCLARTYAIEQGDSLAGTVQGFSMAEMEEQCLAFAPSMAGYQARLASEAPAAVRGALREFVVSTGAPAAQMSGSARICLGVGYRADDAEVALAAAMVLAGLGEGAYDELVGHHLMNGFAAPRRPDRGLPWLSDAGAALAAGATPLVARGSETHAALIEQAVAALSGGSAAPVIQDAAAPAGSQAFLLPGAPPETSN